MPKAIPFGTFVRIIRTLILIFIFALAASHVSAQDAYYDKKMAVLKKSMNKENHKKTLAISQALLKRYPDKTGYNFPRGVAFLGLGMFDKANAVADTFLKNDKNSLNGLRLKGRIYLAQGMGDSAVFYLGRAMLKQGDAYYGFLLGKAQNLVGAYQTAINSFNYSLGEGDKYEAYRERGVSYIGLNDTLKARADFDKAIEMVPGDPVNWNARGYHLYSTTERHLQAIADFDEAIRINKNYAFAFNNRAWSRFKLGKKKGALMDIRLSERRLPNNPFLHRNKGLMSLEYNDGKACKHFRRALELGYSQYHPTEITGLIAEHCAEFKEVKPSENKEKPAPPTRSNAPGG